MNRFTRLFLVQCFILLGFNSYADTWNGISSDISWYSSSATVFHISKAAQLKGLSDLVLVGNTFKDKTIVLDEDLNLGYNAWQPIGGNAWQPIGGDASSVYFDGIFDGQNHKIASVHPKLSNSSYYPISYYGLFGFAGINSIIKNLSVTGGIQIAPKSYDLELYAGGIVGNTEGKLENVATDFDISGSDESYYDIQSMYVGGICGGCNIIEKAKSAGELQFTYANVQWRIGHDGSIGGIAGKAKSIKLASSTCKISAWGKNFTAVGGICGRIADGEVANTCFYGSLAIKNDIFYNSPAAYTACGGIVGSYQLSGESLKICNSISAPTSYNVEPNIYWKNPIVGDGKAPNCSGENNYYTLPPVLGDDLGQVIIENTLRSGEPLAGFNTEVWKFDNGELPMLKCFDEQSSTEIVNVKSASDAKLTILQNKLIFENIKDNTPVSVLGIDGKLMFTGVAHPSEPIVLKSGFYVVKVANSSYKIKID